MEGMKETTMAIHLRNALNKLRDATRKILLEQCSTLVSKSLQFRHQWLAINIATGTRYFDL